MSDTWALSGILQFTWAKGENEHSHEVMAFQIGAFLSTPINQGPKDHFNNINESYVRSLLL